MNKGRIFLQLQKEERIKIEVLLQQGLSLRSIALQLNRSVSTLSRELKRNGPRKYSAAKAQYFTGKRHRFKQKRVVFDQAMIDYIVLNLEKNKWSPELISVQGRKWRPDFVSHEWIYRWIWAMKFSQWKEDQQYRLLYKHLKHGTGRKRRGKQRGNRGNIIGRQWIDQRPPLASNRSRQGDIEADLVLGKGRKAGLIVALDRKSRKTWIAKLKSKEASHVMAKLKNICLRIGNVQTVTLDNDLGFAHHYKLNEMGIATFFTHPFSSQEKGSVENRIGTIRMFFPKKTDITLVNENEIKKVEKAINQRPMRMFNYQSSNEIHIS
jgi:IS30 family transposase